MKKRLLSSIIIFGLLFIVFLSISSSNAQGLFWHHKDYIFCTLDSGGYHGGGIFIPPGWYHVSHSFGILIGLGVIHDHTSTHPLYIDGERYGSFIAFFIGYTGYVDFGVCTSPSCRILAIQGTANFVRIYCEIRAAPL